MTIPSRHVPFLATLFALASLHSAIPIAVAQEKDVKSAKAIRVLFVGNSQIFYNDLPRTIEALSESAPAEWPRIQAVRALAGGASLAKHWNQIGTTRTKIAEEKWDFVVLQDIYNVKPESFNEHARLFHELIREHGAQTILFSTANVSSNYPQGFHELHDMNVALGKELKVRVAAAGKAWLTYWGENPSPAQRLALYAPDKAHPGKKGSYIYACILYAVLTGHSPIGLTHHIPDQPEDTVTAAEAKAFQEAAWHVHQEINGKATAARPIAPTNAKSSSLFNGKDLTGWHVDVPQQDENPEAKATFIVRGGLLVSLGQPAGHLITDAKHENYRLEVEYRFAAKPGNCGVLVHASTPRALYKMFPKSVEVQMNSGHAGDFWCIGEDITVPDMVKRRGPQENWGVTEGKGRRILNLTDDSEKKPGEWNTMVIECFQDAVKVWVNGDLVNHGTQCTASKGQVALQAEGSEVEFRKLELTPLKKLTE